MSKIFGLNAIQNDHPNLDVQWADSINSTQQSVKPNSVLIADQQTAGVGRRGNRWLTPRGKSICFSYRFKLAAHTNQMSGYALMVAVTIIQAMKSFETTADTTVKAQVKWPNDLYCEHKKFGGILINLKPSNPNSTTPNQLDITVGIGINWRLTQTQMQSVNQPICNIPLDKKPDRSIFINHLIKQLNTNNPLFLAQGLNPFLKLWQQHDYLANKTVRVVQDHATVSGQYAGITSQGQLQVSIDGVMKHFSGGEVSVRTI